MGNSASEKGKKPISLVTEPTDFFKQQVTTAFKNQKIEANPNTEFYLVDLLSRFMFSENLFTVDENGSKREETLALLLHEAMHSAEPSRKQQGLRRLGDVSLYTAGFFSDRLSRKVVDVDYYIGMGRNAYGSLAQIGVGASFQAVFTELASNFHRFVDVLAEISETAIPNKDAKNILRLYELWLKTKSERAEKSLKEAGIIPNNLVKPDWQ